MEKCGQPLSTLSSRPYTENGSVQREGEVKPTFRREQRQAQRPSKACHSWTGDPPGDHCACSSLITLPLPGPAGFPPPVAEESKLTHLGGIIKKNEIHWASFSGKPFPTLLN